MAEREEQGDCPAFGLFREWVDRPENSQARVARALGVTAPSVNAWYQRISRPKPHLRGPLAELTDGFVPEESWELASERKARAEALARVRGDDSAPDSPRGAT